MTEPARRPGGAVDAGVFVAAFILLLVSAANGWGALVALSGAVLVGVAVTTAARRQRGESPRPDDPGRPWQRDGD